jgi:hypothetical protein
MAKRNENHTSQLSDNLARLNQPLMTIMDLNPDYEVIDPESLYHGRSYSDWTTDWFNWFVSINADKRNSGPVDFLRSHGLPDNTTGAYVVNTPGQETVANTGSLPNVYNVDLNYPTTYVNDPNIRIGSDKLQIFSDQAVFIPIILAYDIITVPYRDYGNLQDSNGLLVDNGDDPPEPSQLTINSQNLDLEKNKPAKKLKMEDFRITTPIFTGVIPDAPYGTSVKDFVEEGPIPPGNYPAMVDG